MIQDQFTHLKISRQRKYQLRKAAAGCCTECGKPALKGCSRCLAHQVIARERQRTKLGCVRRYNSKTYRLGVAL